MTLYRLNDQTLEVKGLIDQSVTPNVYLNGATVVATLVNATGQIVAQEINGLALVYESASNGNYSAAVAATFSPPSGSQYFLIVQATQGKSGRWRIPCSVEDRGPEL